MIDWTILRTKFGKDGSAERFERLALLYVKDAYPTYEWKPTSMRADGNRDAYTAKDGDYEIWEEAKYRNGIRGSSHKRDRSLERKDIDSTILSGLIYGKVKLIIFITNADMPSEVMLRSMLGARLRGIEVSCVLAPQLEQWLSNHRKVYRSIFEEVFPRLSKNRHTITINRVQFFDLNSTDFYPPKKKRDFFVGERCLLEIIVFSTRPAQARLKQLAYPFEVLSPESSDNSDVVPISPGLSNLTFTVQMKTPCSKRITICVEIDGADCYQDSNWISVQEATQYPIVYGAQLKIIAQIRQLVKEAEPYAQGQLITIYANSSMGKSYILYRLMEEFSLQNDITLITFERNQNSLSNYLLLCKMVLFLFYGNIFWDIVSETPSSILSFKELILSMDRGELFHKEILTELVEGCFDANIAAMTIKSLVKKATKNGVDLIKGRRIKKSHVLLLDDIQYLNEIQSEFVKLLFSQVRSYNNSNIIVATATKGKFATTKAEKQFIQFTPSRFNLFGLSHSDKCETLTTLFQLSKFNADAIADKVLSDSPLLTKEIIRSIYRKNAYVLYENTDSLILSFTHEIDETKLIQNKFSGCKEQFYLLDIIYKFKKGLPIKYIRLYPKFNTSKVGQDVKKLVAENLIVMQNQIVKPYHDYYVSSYKLLRGDKEYNTALGEFLEFILSQRYQTTILDSSHLLAMLLRCGKRFAKAYKAQVKEYILKYTHETQFGAALQFCEYYYEQISPVGTKKLSKEESYYLYLYADCLVHCDYLGRAHEKLQEIYENAGDNSLEKYEAGASILNQLFWEINPKKVIADSYAIQSGVSQILCKRLSSENKRRMLHAYDTCFNRRMMAFFMLDQVNEATEVYRSRLRDITRTNRHSFPSNSATLIMDYARAISFWRPSESFRLMRVAHSFYSKNPNDHYRRRLICTIDLELLSCVVTSQFSMAQFLDVKEDLINGGFLSEYFKAILKHSACKLIEISNTAADNAFSPDAQIFRDIEKEIQLCLLETHIQPHGKELVLLNYIYAFIAARRQNYEYATKLLNECLSIMFHAGPSYKAALQHDINCIESVKNISWCTSASKMDANTYLIDCRYW